MKESNESDTMKELHKIRLAHYEATKNEDLKTVLRQINKRSEKIIKKYRLNLPVLEASKT